MSGLVLITGASRGIGAATALLAARQGYAVAVNYANNSLAADEVVRQIRQDVGAFMGDTEAADDMTLLVLRWRGDGRRGQLLFWPDTLPRARRRELRLAVRAHAVSR